MQLRQFPDKKKFCRLAGQSNVIPVCMEILADTDTPVSILNKLYHNQGPGFLLESVEGGERWGRYSFVGTSARSHIRVFSEHIDVDTNGDCRQLAHHGKPLDVLRNLMSGFRPGIIPELPRFWGGLIGYLSYEMVSFFESIPNNLPPDRPLASFIIPDELIIFDNIQHTLQAMALCFLEDESDPAQAYEQALTRVNALLKKITEGTPDAFPIAEPGKLQLKQRQPDDIYRQHVKTVKDYIHAGDVIQAVIAQPFTCDAPPDLKALYRAQRYINPSPYLFFLHLDDVALVGSSPETMVRLENGIATLRPIAGTRPRGKNEQEDRTLADELLSDEKERAEHLMLVDLGRNDLGRVAETGTVQVTDLMVIERYSHVMHLVSNIVCDIMPDKDAWDLLAATFPAGTLSGAPKIRAMEIIAELESEPRGPYGGAVGYVSFDGNMDLAITIRTACVEKDSLTVRAGAGIVADSDPERERMETINKAMAIQKALQLLANNHQ
ncbi:MAG: chorismate-binding protein [Deltaproteobacteria bacterium]|nr:chorismate-binding protein [Deltaproteobacteria bacterium]